MEENILNLETEMEKLQEYISDIDFCRRKVEKIDAETVMYKTNIKINVLVILTSEFVLICALMKMNQIVMGAGGVLAAATVVCRFWGKVSSRSVSYTHLCQTAAKSGPACPVGVKIPHSPNVLRSPLKVRSDPRRSMPDFQRQR